MHGNRATKTIDQVRPTITTLEAPERDEGGAILAKGVKPLQSVQLREGRL
jgi:hypothetical protein